MPATSRCAVHVDRATVRTGAHRSTGPESGPGRPRYAVRTPFVPPEGTFSRASNRVRIRVRHPASRSSQSGRRSQVVAVTVAATRRCHVVHALSRPDATIPGRRWRGSGTSWTLMTSTPWAHRCRGGAEGRQIRCRPRPLREALHEGLARVAHQHAQPVAAELARAPQQPQRLQAVLAEADPGVEDDPPEVQTLRIPCLHPGQQPALDAVVRVENRRAAWPAGRPAP